MQDEALWPRTKLHRLLGGAAVTEDPLVTGRLSPAAARDGVTKGLGADGTKKVLRAQLTQKRGENGLRTREL